MGTTLTAAVLAGSALTIGHVGDSRAYLLRDGKLRQLTQDHSWVAEQVAGGVLTPGEAEVHPMAQHPHPGDRRGARCAGRRNDQWRLRKAT